ncbi:zinc metallopeptidase [Paenibacillus sp. FSL W8-0186]|uniref:Membrane protease YugP n=1 Tax=Paenibacillus woosongensis TaxID=307580 RepID=A0ABQ4MLF4_9BACL|nr:zinc metallopeptidase [Paenibacillus woosongensis]GIP56824.1 putative membrane protease YugP [Paenibacillus woosongensis]
MSSNIMFIPLLFAFGLSIWAQFKVKGTFNKYAKVHNMYGLTGHEAARRMLDANGLYDVPIEPVRGSLTDHYDPTKRVVRLSEPVYYENSVSAVAVACHEVGHAIQHKESYSMLVLRHKMFPIVNITSQVSPFLILAGFLFGSLNLLGVGIVFFSLAVLFQLVTLPVEFDASNRARRGMLSMGLVSQNDERGVGKVLNAAALTYVAAALISLIELLRFIMMFFQSRD